MTKNSKRRAWTPTQVRTLKTLARKKTHVIWPRMDNAGYPQFCSAANPQGADAQRHPRHRASSAEPGDPQGSFAAS